MLLREWTWLTACHRPVKSGVNSMAVVEYNKTSPYRLCPFEATSAAIVADWVVEDQDLLWLAPSTVPPLTAVKVATWRKVMGQAFCLMDIERSEPIGYGELNPMRRDRSHYWLGHVLIDPARRGQHLGLRMTRALLAYGFHELNARKISLIVFPGNLAAVACYRRAGFSDVGEECHSFARFDPPLRLLRMAVSRHQFTEAG